MCPPRAPGLPLSKVARNASAPALPGHLWPHPDDGGPRPQEAQGSHRRAGGQGEWEELCREPALVPGELLPVQVRAKRPPEGQESLSFPSILVFGCWLMSIVTIFK